MTPLELSILIHYKSCADDFRGGDFTAPAVREAINYFRDDALMIERQSGEVAYKLTEKGCFFVDKLCSIPLPICVWVIPENKDSI